MIVVNLSPLFRRMKYYYAVGYLTPAAIVITALAIDMIALSGQTYGTEVSTTLLPMCRYGYLSMTTLYL